MQNTWYIAHSYISPRVGRPRRTVSGALQRLRSRHSRRARTEVVPSDLDSVHIANSRSNTLDGSRTLHKLICSGVGSGDFLHRALL